MTTHAAGRAWERGVPVTRPATSDAEPLPVSVPVLTFVWLMVISTVLAWRNEVYYSGGIDSVVLAKSAISVVAFVAAYSLWQRSGRGLDIGVRTLSLVSIYLAATVVGGWAAGTLLSAFVVAARVGLLGATLALLVLCTTSWTLMRTLGYALTLMAIGLLGCLRCPLRSREPASPVRLFPLNANQIAMMYGVPLILLVWRAMAGYLEPRAHRGDRRAARLIWLTGSRTGLAATLLAVAIVILLSERVPVPAFLGVHAGRPHRLLRRGLDRSGRPTTSTAVVPAATSATSTRAPSPGMRRSRRRRTSGS